MTKMQAGVTRSTKGPKPVVVTVPSVKQTNVRRDISKLSAKAGEAVPKAGKKPA